MKTSLAQIAQDARASMKWLAQHPHYGTLVAVYDELASSSGLSRSAIMKFYDGSNDNPTINTLDRLLDAIRQATVKAAA